VTRRTIVLVGHSLVRMRSVLIGLGAVLAGFQLLLTQVAAYLTRQNAFGALSALMPDFVRNLAGPSALAFMSFSGIVSLGYFHPIVLSALIGLTIVVATEPAAEVEMRFVDLTLARPLNRAEIVTRTLVVLLISTLAMLGTMFAGTWTGLTCCTPADAERPSLGLTLSLAMSLGSLMLCWGGVALAFASAVRRRAVAGATVGVLAFAEYLLDYLGRAWEPARGISIVSPFHYFEPMTLVAGTALSPTNVAVLIGVGLTGAAAAYVVFSRRDI